MEKRFEKIWRFALPYLRKGNRKDFVLHTEGVVKAMELLLKKEKGDPEILIPAAILHDTGWSRVPLNLQKSNNRDKVKKAMELHLKYSVRIIEEVLTEVGYDKKQIKKVIDVVLAHKFRDPKGSDKRLLIDADTLSDAFKEQFYGDCKAYNISPEVLYKFRKNNKFYTETVKEIFARELEKRWKEISKETGSR